jgi:hypothetical protein
LIDLRQLNQCDLDGTCVEVCPTDVVTLLVQPVEGAGGPKAETPDAAPVAGGKAASDLSPGLQPSSPTTGTAP